jgi:hypothetical protein
VPTILLPSKEEVNLEPIELCIRTIDDEFYLCRRIIAIYLAALLATISTMCIDCTAIEHYERVDDPMTNRPNSWL